MWAPAWNEELELAQGSYSISYIEDYFEYIFKKHGEKTVNISIRIYIDKTENTITFEIKPKHHLELLTPETTKLLGSTKSKITKNENGESVLNLEINRSCISTL